ncbi:long-chain-fatty-acid--CoA ligase [Azospirillum griseum]|uniref:3-methylmercaptopropionyl-CoA ligase n=1 Tax=Azospirillum griseum TaxID=2496639 RepID=A0A3S0KUC5_9PROT|nr:long-chain-fatty-acid--CoA ligase [Azospirillum griseum]RTR13032.1 long-chain-fatty-acid--CoA ligase [Azospirillum griseum]
MLLGNMMDVPLLVSSILRYAETYHGDREIVSRTVEGPIHRYSYAQAAARARRLANALVALGVVPGARVGTLAWNGYRHLELYYAVSGSGMVCHTINPRLFPEQIAYIINHAEDEVLFTDLSFLGMLEGIADQLTRLKAVVVLTDAANMPAASALPNLLCYETLLADQPDAFVWPEFDENTAAAMCYTSGTTGHPKGVLYSHRSCVLHSMTICMPGALGVSPMDVVMPVVPMFHINAWGFIYSAPMVGAKLVLPGPKLDGASLTDLIEAEQVSLTAGVPTVWMGLLAWLDAHPDRSIASLKRLIIGGSACPPVMIEQFRQRGVNAIHGWGMTETHAASCTSLPKPKHALWSPEERSALALKQGRPFYGIEFRVVDEEGAEVPHDGESYGRLLVRGPWVAAGYYGVSDSPSHATPGWFETGDIVTMDADGYIQIVDRAKDLIKSGGEWISSIELENIAVGHPAVREAAVVARPDAQWSERPLLAVVLKEGAALTAADMIAFYEGKVAKWCIPTDLVVLDELPHTATGKILKTALRTMLMTRLAEAQ